MERGRCGVAQGQVVVAPRGTKGDEAQRGVIDTIFMSSLYFPTTFAYDTRTQHHGAPFVSAPASRT